MNKIYETLLKGATKYLANFRTSGTKFTLGDIEKVAGWVISENEKEDKKGWEKADEVVRKFNSQWGERLSWVVKTVVQLCYAFVMIKSAIK